MSIILAKAKKSRLINVFQAFAMTIYESFCDVTARMQLSFGKSFQNNELCTG